MDFRKTLYTRHSVRKYTDQTVDKKTIEDLLKAATQAPSATNSQPWCFGVIQDRTLLTGYSRQAKAYLLDRMDEYPSLKRYHALLAREDYDIFYGASTLVMIYAKPKGPFAVTDCCLAAQNLMLSAHDMGLGSCWIGFSQDFLQQSSIKQALHIPENYTMVAPLIVGFPAISQEPAPKDAPEVLFWQ